MKKIIYYAQIYWRKAIGFFYNLFAIHLNPKYWILSHYDKNKNDSAKEAKWKFLWKIASNRYEKNND